MRLTRTTFTVAAPLFCSPHIQSMPLPPQQAMDPICDGLMDYLDGWALVVFLRTCKAARGCQMQVARVREARREMRRLNTFLAQAVLDRTLRLPGFEEDEIAEARVVPFDVHRLTFQDRIVTTSLNYTRKPICVIPTASEIFSQKQNPGFRVVAQAAFRKHNAPALVEAFKHYHTSLILSA